MSRKTPQPGRMLDICTRPFQPTGDKLTAPGDLGMGNEMEVGEKTMRGWLHGLWPTFKLEGRGYGQRTTTDNEPPYGRVRAPTSSLLNQSFETISHADSQQERNMRFRQLRAMVASGVGTAMGCAAGES